MAWGRGCMRAMVYGLGKRLHEGNGPLPKIICHMCTWGRRWGRRRRWEEEEEVGGEGLRYSSRNCVFALQVKCLPLLPLLPLHTDQLMSRIGLRDDVKLVDLTKTKGTAERLVETRIMCSDEEKVIT